MSSSPARRVPLLIGLVLVSDLLLVLALGLLPLNSIADLRCDPLLRGGDPRLDPRLSPRISVNADQLCSDAAAGRRLVLLAVGAMVLLLGTGAVLAPADRLERALAGRPEDEEDERWQESQRLAAREAAARAQRAADERAAAEARERWSREADAQEPVLADELGAGEGADEAPVTVEAPRPAKRPARAVKAPARKVVKRPAATKPARPAAAKAVQTRSSDATKARGASPTRVVKGTAGTKSAKAVTRRSKVAKAAPPVAGAVVGAGAAAAAGAAGAAAARAVKTRSRAVKDAPPTEVVEAAEPTGPVEATERTDAIATAEVTDGTRGPEPTPPAVQAVEGVSSRRRATRPADPTRVGTSRRARIQPASAGPDPTATAEVIAPSPVPMEPTAAVDPVEPADLEPPEPVAAEAASHAAPGEAVPPGTRRMVSSRTARVGRGPRPVVTTRSRGARPIRPTAGEPDSGADGPSNGGEA